jgi:pilus assembly protein CpaC
VSRKKRLLGITVAALLWMAALGTAASASQNEAGQPGGATPGKLTVTVGKSLIIDSPLNIQRLSVANGDLVEAVAVNPKEVLINGKGPGETSLIVWQQNGNRLLYDLTIRPSPLRLENVRQQLAREFPDANISVTYENDTAFVRGQVKDLTAADRVMAIVATLGKAVNLLRVDVPPAPPQVLLKVKFADVDRSASTSLGFNLASAAFNQSTNITTGQFPGLSVDNTGTFSLSNALNILLFRKDINLGATIEALQAKNLLQILAEPNVLAINGKQASFLEGGEFPFPTLQGGAGVGAVTISWREFGIRLNFLPTVTPRGTVRLQVAPEVSSLDYTNAVTFEGVTIPALSNRRVTTEVELDSGQSFVIAGLLNNQMTDSLSKIPGLSSIPLFGKLFQSKQVSKSNNELLVIITPELVRPIPEGQPLPELTYPEKFLAHDSKGPFRQPGISQTGPVPVQPPADSLPVEELMQLQKAAQPAGNPATPPFQLVPVPVPQAAQPANPGLTPGPSSAPNPAGTVQ